MTHFKEWSLFPWPRDLEWLTCMYSLHISKAKPSLPCLGTNWQADRYCCHSSCWFWFYCCSILNYAHAQELSRTYWTNLFLQEGAKWAVERVDNFFTLQKMTFQFLGSYCIVHFGGPAGSAEFWHREGQLQGSMQWPNASHQVSPYHILGANTCEEGPPLHCVALLSRCWLILM